MVPTGQTVVAVLLALGLARGPSEGQPETPPDRTETPDATSPDPAGSEAPAEPEPEPEPAAESEPEANAEGVRAAPPPAAVPALEEQAATPAPDVPAADAPAELEDEEAWEEEAWEEEEDGWDDDYDPLRDSPEAVTAQRRIAGGGVVLGLGAMVSVGGLAMVLSDPCARPAGNSCSPAARNRAALTMALPGLATVAVGSVMLALGLRQREALRVDASLNASGAGVSFRGRF